MGKKILALSLSLCVAATGCVSQPVSKEAVAIDLGLTAAENAQRTPASGSFVQEIRSGRGADDNLFGAKDRMEKIFEFARSNPQGFFKELRRDQPIFVSKGASGKVPNLQVRAWLNQGLIVDKAIPNVYLITRYDDVEEVLNQHSVFTVKPYQEVMEGTVGGPFMLSRENHAANGEKPFMRHMLNKNDLSTVRRIVRQLAKEAIAEGTNEKGELDIVKSVTRRVPLMLNSDYFGFYGPDMETMAKWSRHAQHAFFHNPFKDPKVVKAALESGKEMQSYVKTQLLPETRAQMAGGKPANDVLTKMLGAGAMHAKYGLNEDRLAIDTLGMLIGSVETTSAAIAQSLQVLMSQPNLLAGAVEAARRGDDQLLSRYVWEALRFDAVNPWLGRFSVADYVLAKGTARETLIPRGSLILASTESAMHDESVFPNPEQFRLDRDPSKYMHLGYGYHKCLGDDVSLVMVPETIKQILVLPHVRQAVAGQKIDYKKGPFPEAWTLIHDDRPSSKEISDRVDDIGNYLGLGELVVGKTAQAGLVLKATEAVAALKSKSPEKKKKAMYEIPGLVSRGLAQTPHSEVVRYCMDKNPKSKTAFVDATDRLNYCSVRVDFRACYFVQRLANSRSPLHSYNHCVYNRKFLSSPEQSDFKQKFSKLSTFSFLDSWN